MSIDPDELAAMVGAYLGYQAWFARDGFREFEAHQAKVWQLLGRELGAVTSALTGGPAAVQKAPGAMVPAVEKNLDPSRSTVIQAPTPLTACAT